MIHDFSHLFLGKNLKTNINKPNFRWWSQKKIDGIRSESAQHGLENLPWLGDGFHHGDDLGIFSGGWAAYPSEKWWSESQLGLLFPIYGKNKNVPNHQAVLNGFSTSFEATNQFWWGRTEEPWFCFPTGTLYNCNTSWAKKNFSLAW